jgi:serine/threonine protein kinase
MTPDAVDKGDGVESDAETAPGRAAVVVRVDEDAAPSDELLGGGVSEVAAGVSLDSYVEARGAIAPREALRIALDIARTIQHAHERGIIHGGLRPSNVFIAPSAGRSQHGVVRITDLGAADVVPEARPADGYMSPERRRGAPASATSDVYAIGALLHHLLTGRPPLGPEDAPPDATVPDPMPPAAMPADLAPNLTALLDRLSRRDASQRLQNAKDLVAVIGALLASVDDPSRTLDGETSQATAIASDELDAATTKRRPAPPAGTPHRSGGLVGRLLDGRFQVVSFLRSGGMAQLYSGTQDAEPRLVAIKAVHPRLAAEPKVVKRFAREARLAARLHHPNIVRVVHVGDAPRLLYIAMEMLSGEDLSARVKERGRLAEAEAVSICIEVAAALAYAHGLGVVHRDIKPANVMLCPGEGRETPKLLDFGIAKVLERSEHVIDSAGGGIYSSAITSEGAVVGTPHYMAPEQAGGAEIDHRADLYSLGVVLYELVTGAVPFRGQTPLEIIAGHLQQPPRPPSQLVGGLNPELERLVLDLLQKKPEARPRSASEVRERLLRMLPGLAKSALAATESLGLDDAPAPVAPPPTLPMVVVDRAGAGGGAVRVHRHELIGAARHYVSADAPPGPDARSPVATAPSDATREQRLALPAGVTNVRRLVFALIGLLAVLTVVGLLAARALRAW